MQLLFEDVRKEYAGRAVVDDLTLSVDAGTIVALAGVNGSGKSTLFRIAAGFVEPTSGRVSIAGDDWAGPPLRERPACERVRMGLAYIPQTRGLLRRFSTMDNLRVAMRGANAVPRDTRTIFEGLAALRLGHLVQTPPSEMTSSEAMFLLLAKAYLTEPRFLIADEPFTGLNAPDVQLCFAILRKMQGRGTGILLTDHHAGAMLEVADAVHIVESGKIVFSESAAATRSSAEAERRYFRRRAQNH